MSKKRRKSGVEDTQPHGAEQPAGEAPQLRLHTPDELDEPKGDTAASAADEQGAERSPGESPAGAVKGEGDNLAASEAPDAAASGDQSDMSGTEGTSHGDTEASPSELEAQGRENLEGTDGVGEGASNGDDESAPSGDDVGPGPVAEGEINIQQVVEAILFSTETPLTPQRIVSVLGVGSVRDVKAQIKALNERYEREGAAFRIEQIAGGYQMLSMPQFNTWIRRLRQARQESRFSAAALETLAVVAYKQPVVRAEIEAIRGVAAGEMLNRLRELGLVKIVGRAEDVGRPMLYGTTKRFLELFGLASLEDLPSVEQLQPPK